MNPADRGSTHSRSTPRVKLVGLARSVQAAANRACPANGCWTPPAAGALQVRRARRACVGTEPDEGRAGRVPRDLDFGRLGATTRGCLDQPRQQRLRVETAQQPVAATFLDPEGGQPGALVGGEPAFGLKEGRLPGPASTVNRQWMRGVVLTCDGTGASERLSVAPPGLMQRTLRDERDRAVTRHVHVHTPALVHDPGIESLVRIAGSHHRVQSPTLGFLGCRYTVTDSSAVGSPSLPDWRSRGCRPSGNRTRPGAAPRATSPSAASCWAARRSTSSPPPARLTGARPRAPGRPGRGRRAGRSDPADREHPGRRGLERDRQLAGRLLGQTRVATKWTRSCAGRSGWAAPPT